jgi:hypothetical protein
MADQVNPGPDTGTGYDGGTLVQPGPGAHPGQAFHGRPVSWVAVSIIMAGFLAGGLGLILGPTWWLFWCGAAAAAIGGLLALGTNIFEDWY